MHQEIKILVDCVSGHRWGGTVKAPNGITGAHTSGEAKLVMPDGFGKQLRTQSGQIMRSHTKLPDISVDLPQKYMVHC